MALVLDSGGVSALTGQRARLAELRHRGAWPPLVPAVVLTEALTGDPRRDVVANRLLRMCLVRPVGEDVARVAARLRTGTGRAGTISAVDALVAAIALRVAEPVVLTSDPDDLRALVAVSGVEVLVARA